MDKNKNVAIYRSKDGEIQLEVKFEKETVWLTQRQMAELFSTTYRNIGLHIKNIYKNKELSPGPTRKKSFLVQEEAGRKVKRNVSFYNLDLIISIGYRVNTKRGIDFRVWATNVLRQYLVNGYALNEKRLKQQETKIRELHEAVGLLTHVMEQKKLGSDEAVGLLKVITDYTLALDLLNRYDHGSVELNKRHLSRTKAKQINYDEALDAIDKFSRRSQSSELFGKPKDSSFKGSIDTIYQTFDGRELYPTLEEKAAHLLYFIVKDHSFIDGNKRIGAFMFLYFMEKNHILYKPDGSRILGNNALVAVTLMIAESRPVHKDIMVKMIVNLIDKRN